MQKKDKKHFSKKMLGLAQMFNNAVEDARAKKIDEDGLNSVFDKHNDQIDEVYAAFKAKGYSDQEWDELTISSGAKKLYEQPFKKHLH